LSRADLRVALDPVAGGAPRLAVPEDRCALVDRLLQRRRLDHVLLPVAAVRGPADVRSARARSGITAGGVLGPRGSGLEDVPLGGLPVDRARHRRRFDLRVLAHAGRLHRGAARGQLAVHRQRDLRQRRSGEQRPVRGRVRPDAGRDHVDLPLHRMASRRLRGALGGRQMESRAVRIAIRIGMILVLAFLYVPLLIVVIYSFNNDIGQTWPIDSFTTKYYTLAWQNPLVRTALGTSLLVASIATLLAFVLGSLAAFAVHRFHFFGLNAVSFVLVLPIALPGILTGIALNNAINNYKIPFSIWTIMIGHATFCIVVVYNNVLARLRRTAGSQIEASMDLGADGWQTFRYVTWPAIRTAVVAGMLLAFALSFDEIVVTNFTSGSQVTIPKFIYDNLRQPLNRTVVNVEAVIRLVE